MKKLLLIVCLFCTVNVLAQKRKVVISESIGNSVSEDVRNGFKEALTAGLNNSGKYTVLESRADFSRKIMDEKQFQESGLVDDNQQLELGHALGADCVCNVAIFKMGTNYQITCKITQIDGEVIASPLPMPTKNGEEDLIDIATEMASLLATGKNLVAKKEPNFSSCPSCSENDKNLLIEPKDNNAKTWEEANNICQNKGEGWRLPTLEELQQVYYKRITINGSTFKPTTYWTGNDRNPFSVFTVDFSNGSTTYVSKSSYCVFRCVCESEK